MNRTFNIIGMLIFLISFPSLTSAQVLAPPSMKQFDIPSQQDLSAPSLRRYQQQIIDLYGGTDQQLPLEVKAEYFEWMLWKYFQTPYQQVMTRVILPEEANQPLEYRLGADVSTWNGCLLAALSYKYAVTKDPNVLKRISEVLYGIHFFIQVTGKPGLVSRCVLPIAEPIEGCDVPYTAPNGVKMHYRDKPAKGTYNQLMLGYATLLMYAYDDLPEEVQRLARWDANQLAVHIVDHNYQVIERDGSPSPYSSITPVIARKGIPFNAQVAYQIVATGKYFPCDDPNIQERLNKAFDYIRVEHHAYYEKPLRTLIYPQKIGAHPLVKGMNDRNHVHNAAYIGIALELHLAQKQNRQVSCEFLFQLGRTMYWTMEEIEKDHNSLCNFMWIGLLQRRAPYHCIIREEFKKTDNQLIRMVNDGIEQLKRFPLERAASGGEKIKTKNPVWVDQQRPDSYQWKSNTDFIWKTNGKLSNNFWAPIDFLHAYWLFRAYQLDEHPKIEKGYLPILAKGRRNVNPQQGNPQQQIPQQPNNNQPQELEPNNLPTGERRFP